MQIINKWPTDTLLAIPCNVKKALLKHLLEPFSDEVAACAFWAKYPSTIFFIEASENIDSLRLLNDITQHQIEFALSYPEYSEPLTEEYTVNLSITNDEGAGIYLVINNGSELLQLEGQK